MINDNVNILQVQSELCKSTVCNPFMGSAKDLSLRCVLG